MNRVSTSRLNWLLHIRMSPIHSSNDEWKKTTLYCLLTLSCTVCFIFTRTIYRPIEWQFCSCFKCVHRFNKKKRRRQKLKLKTSSTFTLSTGRFILFKFFPCVREHIATTTTKTNKVLYIQNMWKIKPSVHWNKQDKQNHSSSLWIVNCSSQTTKNKKIKWIYNALVSCTNLSRIENIQKNTN